MKQIISIMLLLPALSYAENYIPNIPTRELTPIVKFSDNKFELRDLEGNRWSAETSCLVEPNEITEFTIRERRIREGTRVTLAKNKSCRIENLIKG